MLELFEKNLIKIINSIKTIDENIINLNDISISYRLLNLGVAIFFELFIKIIAMILIFK